ncbi:MAG: sulfurtransferase [Acidiferrobacterales bacterium]
MDSLNRLLIEPTELQDQLDRDDLLVVDLCRPEVYMRSHIPSAVHLEYSQIVAPQPPAMGMLPNAEQLAAALGALGLTPDTHVVAYDDEGGGLASRLLWTLDVVGHTHASLLDGGLHAWAAEHRPLSSESVNRKQTKYAVTLNEGPVANKDYVLARLEDPDVVLLDTRSPAEYNGSSQRAARGGHIPGAINFDWVNAIDQSRSLRLKPQPALRAALTSLGVVPDKEVITYCQTHHRSAHTYMVLKTLGYPRIKGYPGSWSEWGNRTDTPVSG